MSIQRVGVHFALPHPTRLVELQAAGEQLALVQVSSEAKLISTVPAGPDTRFTLEINGDVRRFEFNLEGINPHLQGIACREPLKAPSPVIIAEPEKTQEISPVRPGKGGDVAAPAGAGAAQSYSYAGAVSAIAGGARASAKSPATIIQGSEDSVAESGGSGSVFVLLLVVVLAAVAHTQRGYFRSQFPGAEAKLLQVVHSFKPGGNDKGIVSLAECKGIVSASENDVLGGAADPEEARPMAKAPNTLPQPAATTSKKKWKVTLDLGASPWSVAVAKSSVSSGNELKQLIFEACAANVGVDLLPKEWIVGRLDGMQVQFLDLDDALVSLDECQDLSAVEAARSLHVQVAGTAVQQESARSSGGPLTTGSASGPMDMDD